MNRRASRVVFFLCAVLGVALMAAAQQQQGRISGRVTDPDDIIVYQADVQVINLDTKAATPQKTDTTGSYWVEPLAPGRYEVTVKADGFQPYKSPDLNLAAGEEIIFNIQLKRAAKKD